MTTPPIRIPILADDQTAAGIATVQARVATFGANVQAAGAQAEVSMSAARHGMMLAAEEMDVHLNRSLRAAILEYFPGVAKAAAAAFPLLGAIAFIGIAEQVHQSILNMTSSLAGWGEAEKQAFDAQTKAYGEFVKQLDEIKQKKRENALIGLDDVSAARLKKQFAFEDLDPEARRRQIDAALAEYRTFVAETEQMRGRAALIPFAPLRATITGHDDPDFIRKRDADAQQMSIDIGKMNNSFTLAGLSAEGASKQFDLAVGKSATDEVKLFGAELDKVYAKAQSALGLGDSKVDKEISALKDAIDAVNAYEEQHPGIIFGSLNAYKEQIQAKVKSLQYELEHALSGAFSAQNSKQITDVLNVPPAVPTLWKSTAVGQITAVQDAMRLLGDESKRTFSNMDLFFANNGNLAQAWGRAILGMLSKVVTEMIYTYVISQLLNGLFFRLQGGMDLTAATAAQHSALTPPSLSFGGGPSLPNFGGVINAVSPLSGSGFRNALNTAGRTGGGTSAIHVSVHNESSQPVQVVSAHPQVTPEGMIIGVILRDVENGGRLHDVFKAIR